MSVIITALIESIEIPCAIPTCCRSRFQTDQIAQLSLVVLTLNCIWLVCYTPWRPICCSTCQLRHSLQCVHCEFLPFLNSLSQHLLLLLFVSQLSIMITTCIQHMGQHMVQCGRHVCVSTQQPLVANLRVKTLACLLPTCCRSRFQTDQIAQLSLVVLTLNCIWLVCYTPWRPICCSTCQLRHSLQCVHSEFS
jgi:hypothetical protein